MSTLDVLLLGCIVVLAVLALTTPTRCKHPCAQCAAERAEKAKATSKSTEQYEHSIGLDRELCGSCRRYHCRHDGCSLE